MIRGLMCILLIVTLPLLAKPNRDELLSRYKKYPFDEKVTKKHQKEWDSYTGHYEKLKDSETQISIEERKELIAILEGIHKQEPGWIEAYWLIASEKFQLASSYTEESDLPLARKILSEGRDKAKACLEIQKDNPLCKFFLASSLGKIGTIDGVFSSLKGAEEVEDLWMAALESPYNHFFTDVISMQGSVRYAFGIFYRLIPNWTILKWLFGVKGDLDKSIEYLEEAIAMDGPFPCSRLMLAASLFCRSKGEAKSKDFLDAMNQIQMIGSMKNMSIQSETCKRDAEKMRLKPSNGCGYSTAKQQEEPDENKVK